MRIPVFCGGTNQSSSSNWDAEFAMNCFPERQEVAGQKSPIAQFLVPGKKVAYSLVEASVPGIFPINGRGFAAASNLYELLVNGTTINRGSLGGAPLGPTQIISNETSLLILNNGNLYVFVLATNVLTAVNMAQFAGAGSVLQIDFCDGYGIAVLVNSHTWQQSNLEDFTTWNGLNIATISYFPDNIISMKVDHRELWFFSGKKSIGYYNAGAGFPAFIPIQGAYLEDGAAATWATVQLDNSILWLARDERGALIAKRLNGYAGQRISTHAIEQAWQKYSRTDDAVAFTYQENGHGFWQVRFPTANTTWDYDVASNLWHQRGFWNGVQFLADRSTCHAYIFDKHLVGDWNSGNIYDMSTRYRDDNGAPIRWVRRSPIPGAENKEVYISEVEIDMQVGVGPQPPLLDGAGKARSPQVELKLSRDAAKTWGSPRLLNMGQAGEYNQRVRSIMWGRARKPVFELSGSDPVFTAIADAYVTAVPSNA